ncbi:HV348 protein, partial [Hemiprocne comata]|nr:HV348 protein [Hemiprocne comata]
GVWAQPRLVEAGGGLRAPRDSVLLSCRGFSFNFEQASIWWYRQAPNNSPEFLSYVSFWGVIKYGAAVEGRAMLSRDNSRSELSLFLPALHHQDSACYFCASHTE